MTTVFLIMCSLALMYTYAGYPLLLWILGHLSGRKQETICEPEPWPAVTLIVAIHDAAALLPNKLKNLETLDYPGNLAVLFVLDGCTDESKKLIQSAQAAGFRWPITFYESVEWVGKEAALQKAIPNVASELMVFSDADAALHRNTVKELVKVLVDESVAVVCGQEVHSTSRQLGAGQGESYFYRYENFVKVLQSRVSSMTYVQGGVFAMKKEFYPSRVIPGCTIDGLIAFNSVLRRKQVRHVATAISEEKYDISTGKDFSRRIRTVCHAFYSILREPRIFLPWKTGFYGLHVLSHRLLRWFAVPLLIAIFILTASLAEHSPAARAFLLLQLLFYAAALAGAILEAFKVRLKPLYICYYFMYIHMAALAAVILVALGHRVTTWRPTAISK